MGTTKHYTPFGIMTTLADNETFPSHGIALLLPNVVITKRKHFGIMTTRAANETIQSQPRSLLTLYVNRKPLQTFLEL